MLAQIRARVSELDRYFESGSSYGAPAALLMHDLAFRRLETALEKGAVDAIYTQSKVFRHLQEDTGKFKVIVSEPP